VAPKRREDDAGGEAPAAERGSVQPRVALLVAAGFAVAVVGVGGMTMLMTPGEPPVVEPIRIEADPAARETQADRRERRERAARLERRKREARRQAARRAAARRRRAVPRQAAPPPAPPQAHEPAPAPAPQPAPAPDDDERGDD
jgi:hypothetical protein